MRQIQVGEWNCHYQDRGDGPILLLVHGFPLDHSMWQHQLNDLTHYCRVIAPDLRGFGAAAKPLRERQLMSQFADELAGLLDALQIDEPITYAGLSMGGYIAFPFCSRHAERVERLILMDTRAAADTPVAAENRLEMATRVEESGSEVLVRAMQQKLYARVSHAHAAAEISHLEQVMNSTPVGSIAAALRGMAARSDSTPLLPQLKMPALLIAGEEDELTPAAEMQQMAAAMPAAKFAAIADAGHMAPLEQPQEVNKLVASFMQG